MTENQPTVKVRIYRSQAGRHQEYEVPLRDKMSVLNVLQYVSENYDGGLSYYASCRRGLCAGCAVKVNGKAKLACVELVTGDVTIEPLSGDRVVKDLLIRSSHGEERPS